MHRLLLGEHLRSRQGDEMHAPLSCDWADSKAPTAPSIGEEHEQPCGNSAPANGCNVCNMNPARDKKKSICSENI